MRSTILISWTLCSAALAQSSPTFEQRTAERGEAIHGALGFDFTSQYFFRGIRQEAAGIIGQPWIDLSLDLVDGDSGLRDLDIVFGQWNSLHDGRTGGAGGVWYESRFYLGVEAEVGERMRFGVRYNTYDTPNGSAIALARPIQEVAFYGAYNDSGLISDDFQLNPTVTIAYETVGQRDRGGDRGTYAEFAVAPAWDIGHYGGNEITLTVPTRLGLSFGDYYERTGGGNDDFLGYLQAGGVVSAPLTFLPARLGPWTGHFGVHALVLGDNNQARNGGDTLEVFIEFGMSTTF